MLHPMCDDDVCCDVDQQPKVKAVNLVITLGGDPTSISHMLKQGDFIIQMLSHYFLLRRTFITNVVYIHPILRPKMSKIG